MPVPHPPRGMQAFATLALFTALAGDAWRNSISWAGWIVLVAAIMVGAAAWLVRFRRDIRPDSLPYPLIVFLALSALSIVWSAYPGWTVLGVAAQWGTTLVAGALAFLMGWRAFLAALTRALKLVVGLSLAFEAVVATFIRGPVFPLFTDWTADEVPITYAWSRGLLWEGGPIQGIVHNASTLAFAGLLLLICITLQWFSEADRLMDADSPAPRTTTARRHATRSMLWIVAAIATLLLTRSEMVFVALIAAALTVVAVVVVHRMRRGLPRIITGALTIGAALAAMITVVVKRHQVIDFFEQTGLLTGRLDNWRVVLDLASERPLAGWGWLGYWVPWVEPFDGLVIRNDTQQLHAHNAWFDVYLQLGVLGVIVLAALVISTLTRAWFIALDGVGSPTSGDRMLSLLPLLLVVVLVVQTAGESRLLIEYGWLLLAFVAIATRRVASAPHGPARWLPPAARPAPLGR